MLIKGANAFLISNGFYLLILFIALSSSMDSLHFNVDDVLKFVNDASKTNLSMECTKGLDRMHIYLKDSAIPDEERHLYSESFVSGNITKDHRQNFNTLKCINAAGEKIFSASKYPTHYCYGHDLNNRNVIYGICIPSACNNDGIKLLSEWQEFASKGGDNQTLKLVKCTSSRYPKQWYQRPLPLIHLSSDLLLIVLVSIATVVHLLKGGDSRSWSHQLLLAFSAKRNFQKLIQVPKGADATITCMFGLRFLAMVWTLVGHMFIEISQYITNVDYFKVDLVDSFWNQWLTNFTLCTDVFFVLSGTLVAYSWFRKWQNNIAEAEPTWTSYGYWLRFYRHRVIRLWPAMIYTMLAISLRLSVTHYRALWPPSNEPATQCAKHWWENLLFINSLTEHLGCQGSIWFGTCVNGTTMNFHSL